ncbi:hypothetical protein DN752_22210 [Echinicola strongylocentroti]|uniref:Uncharacterized protein n=1 Tax=Echinicola strongylocentroti TaxID=1795355 RepID=A0A2Z4ING1_9BACT|nr:hypothetical protein [Echinicola strongylocentroti]AWW32641.1 hypothetical protein DN752_22210 [Echinicola strongylocentroti]
MKLSEKNRRILLDYLNGQIDDYSRQQTESFLSSISAVKPYGEAEIKAYQAMQENVEGSRLLLERLLQLNARELFFDFFCIIDGVGDPEDKDWSGVLLMDKPDDFDEHVEFLHDEF